MGMVLAHMAHTATKMSCGVGGNTSRATNLEMADLITKMTKVITQVKLVSTTGDLFAQLCKSKTKGASTRLVGYSASRFLSMTNAMRRVLDKWPAIVAWHEERGRQAIRDHKPPPSFPIANRQTDLIQVLSIFKPIAELKFKCQAERAEQVDVLMALYMSRLDDLGQDQPIRHYQTTYEDPQWISASALTSLASKTRDLLREALDERFFSRYYNDSQFEQSHFVLEMMLKLHPIYKNTQESLNRVVVMCCRQHGKSGREAVDRLREVTAKVRENLLNLLRTVAGPPDPPRGQTTSTGVPRMEARFAPRVARPTTTSRADRRAEKELDRWMEDPIDVERLADMTPKEFVLQFWKRLEHAGEYSIIPKAVRVLFAIPASSCQIERDFSVGGEMVSSQRTSLAGDSVDMCIFLNRNSEFVNLLQCEEIPRGQHHLHRPSNFVFDIDPDLYMDDFNADILAEFVTSTNLSSEEEEKSSH